MGEIMDKSSKQIRKLFDDITPTYDLLNHLLSMSVDKGWRKRTLAELSIVETDRVLDIATGTGDLAISARMAKNCPLVGLDLSRGMLMEAVRKWGQAFEGDSFQAVQGDALSMPFDDGTFDKAMVAFGVRNMPDIGGFLDEAHRVLRTPGRLAILEFSTPTNPFFRQIYLLYLTKILPFIGGLRSGNRAAYKYLSDSIQEFPSPPVLCQIFEEHGFKVIKSIPLTMGICYLHILEK